MWLVIFPEGTRYNVTNTAALEKSRAFAAEQGKNNAYSTSLHDDCIKVYVHLVTYGNKH